LRLTGLVAPEEWQACGAKNCAYIQEFREIQQLDGTLASAC
jgi:hypothetical protein